MPAVTCIYYLNKGVFENGTDCKGNEFHSAVPDALIAWSTGVCEQKNMITSMHLSFLFTAQSTVELSETCLCESQL